MTRTYRRLTSGESHPFVAWPDEASAWIEGVVQREWKGEYGAVIELLVEDSAQITGVTGAGEERNGGIPIRPGDVVNLGLNLAQLAPLSGVPRGAGVRVGFAGWSTTRAGHRFRRFKVDVEEGAEISPPAPMSAPAAGRFDEPPAALSDSEDDGLPF